MKLRIALALACILGFTSIQAVHSFEVSSIGLHLHISGLQEPRPPEVIEGYLVLSARGPYRFVGAAFSHEDWRTVHAYERNLNGVFVLAVPIPYGEGMTTQYRLVVDGLWMADPINPQKMRDPATGVALSYMVPYWVSGTPRVRVQPPSTSPVTPASVLRWLVRSTPGTLSFMNCRKPHRESIS